MQQSTVGKNNIVIPCLVITLGTGWLLTSQSVIPGVDWVWVLGLGVLGILVLAIGGVNKVTAVVGPFLIIATFLSILRQTGRLAVETEVPILVILVGVLMLVSSLLPLPQHRWFTERDKDSSDISQGGPQ